MSENANFRQNLQNVPSIFEITAAETLDNLIYPALSRVFDYFGLRLNFALWGQRRLKEELSPVVTWILQFIYLRKHDSSFGESFYGLQRTDTATGAPLTREQKFISATILTLMPCIERRLKTRIANHENTYKWEKYLLNVFHAYKVSKSVHIFLYLIKYAASHSPIFRALGLTLRYPAVPVKEDKATYLFMKALEVFAFFLQFIQWWYSNDQRRKVGGSLKNPPPKEDLYEPSNSRLQMGECPVCLMELKNPTACSVSGYVYCWKCIVNHLKTDSTCPQTGLPISIDDLITVYED